MEIKGIIANYLMQKQIQVLVKRSVLAMIVGCQYRPQILPRNTSIRIKIHDNPLVIPKV